MRIISFLVVTNPYVLCAIWTLRFAPPRHFHSVFEIGIGITGITISPKSVTGQPFSVRSSHASSTSAIFSFV
jgi:hypothetical protein